MAKSIRIERQKSNHARSHLPMQIYCNLLVSWTRPKIRPTFLIGPAHPRCSSIQCCSKHREGRTARSAPKLSAFRSLAFQSRAYPSHHPSARQLVPRWTLHSSDGLHTRWPGELLLRLNRSSTHIADPISVQVDAFCFESLSRTYHTAVPWGLRRWVQGGVRKFS